MGSLNSDIQKKVGELFERNLPAGLRSQNNIREATVTSVQASNRVCTVKLAVTGAVLNNVVCSPDLGVEIGSRVLIVTTEPNFETKNYVLANVTGSGSSAVVDTTIELELARVLLSSTSDIIEVLGLPKRNFLRLKVVGIPTGGTIGLTTRFNGDTGSNYATRNSDNGAADSTSLSSTAFTLHANTSASLQFSEATILNIDTQEKLVQVSAMNVNATGAGTATNRSEKTVKWANTSDQITQITITNAGTGSYDSGSQLIVYGHD